MPEKKIKRTADFVVKHNEKEFTFRYNPLDITIEQAEPALAIAMFMADVNYNPPETAHDLIKSKAHRWITEIMKYLLFEISDKKQLPFNANNIEQTSDLIKKLPAKELKRLEDCVEDFLLGMNRQETISKLQQTKRNLLIPALAKVLKSTQTA
jgi:hypothetical protein